MKPWEAWISWTLRGGVAVAALLAGVGGLAYLVHNGRVPIEEALLREGIPGHTPFDGPLGLIRIGLLILILTPMARVGLSLFLFLRDRDWTFALLTGWVLGVLVAGLLGLF